jgi:hypothetical protein
MKLFSKKQSDTPRRRLATTDDISAPKPNSDIFKRNRTLTGTTSNRLDSLNIIKSGLESPRAHVHHLTSKRRRVFSIFIAVLIFVAFLWTLISNFTATVVISTADTITSKPIDESIYKNAIQDYLDVNPLSRFQFLLDRSALSIYVSSQMPEIEAITNSGMANIGVTDFAVKMRVPVASWKINDKQYYVDAKGVPFEKNYYDAPAVQIIDNSGVSLQTGTVSVSKRFLGFVGRVVSLAKGRGYIVAQAILPANTTRELEIKLKDSNLLVKLSIDRSAGEQVEDMSRAMQYFVNHNKTPAYIDVRVSGKAFYK